MKQLTQFFDAFANIASQIRFTADRAWLDHFPQTTTFLERYLDQFGLDDSSSLTNQEKRDRLDAAWKATGSLAPRYLQDTLQGLGFGVYVHEFWVPGSEPSVGVNACATVRNPALYLTSEGNPTSSFVQCGELAAQCGELEAQCGNTISAKGYLLVNKVVKTTLQYTVLCGEVGAQCGEVGAQCGESTGVLERPITYPLPNDSDKWPFFVYIGAETFPTLATLPSARRDEFERTLLKYCPTHLWIGVLVNYV